MLPNNDQGEAASNFWMSVVEGAMCAVFILTTMIVAPGAAKSSAAQQVVVEAKAAEVSPMPPMPDAPGDHASIKPTHRLVALPAGDAQTGDIVIELDRELPANAAVKFVYNKPQ